MDQETKLFLMNLKVRQGKSGARFYTGKLGSLDVIGFDKKDNSGDITIWVKQAPMRDFNQRPQGSAQPQRPPARPPQNYAPQSAPPADLWDGPGPDPEF